MCKTQWKRIFIQEKKIDTNKYEQLLTEITKVIITEIRKPKTSLSNKNSHELKEQKEKTHERESTTKTTKRS